VNRIAGVINPVFRATHVDFHLADMVRRWAKFSTSDPKAASRAYEEVLEAIKHLRSPQHQLNILDLSGMTLSMLPPHFLLQNLDGITILDLRGNCLCGEELDKLNSITSLKQLYLSDNPLQNIPCFTIRNQRRLNILEVEKCQLKDFPEDILYLHELDVLNISGNEFKMLPDDIGYSLKNLAELNITNTNIHKLPDSLRHLNGLVVNINPAITSSSGER
jgi:Leucine-rich repeat (LRR) protein